MFEFKEKSKVERPKGKSSAAADPRQIAKLIKEKTRRQTEQRREEPESEANYATEQIETLERRAANEAVRHVPRPHSRNNGAEQGPTGQAEPRVAYHTSEGPRPSPKGETLERPRSGARTSEPLQVGVTPGRKYSRSEMPKNGVQTSPKGKDAPKERTPTIFKTRPDRPPIKNTQPPVKARSLALGTKKAAGDAAKRQINARMTVQSQRTAKAAVQAVKKAAAAVIKAVASLAGSLIGLIGGGALLVSLAVVVAIAAVVSSPMGIFFADEQPAPGAVTPSEAVEQIEQEYIDRLAAIVAGDYDEIDASGQPPAWRDVLAVFAVKTAGVADGTDVATLDAGRVELLRQTFWDMTLISADVEDIPHPDSDPDDEVDDSWIERILHIAITGLTADEASSRYGFLPDQQTMLDQLLAPDNEELWNSLL